MRTNFGAKPWFYPLPVALECRLLKVNEDGNSIGQILNVSVDDTILNGEGQIDPELFHPISFDPANNIYRALGEKTGNAFWDGGRLK